MWQQLAGATGRLPTLRATKITKRLPQLATWKLMAAASTSG